MTVGGDELSPRRVNGRGGLSGAQSHFGMVPIHTSDLNANADKAEKAMFIRCSNNFLIERNQEVAEKKEIIFAIRCSEADGAIRSTDN
jgi:hypothetical protein